MVRMSSSSVMGRMLLAVVALVAFIGGACGPYHYEDIVSSAGTGARGGGMSRCVPQGEGGCGGEESCDEAGSHVSLCLVDEGLLARYFLDDFTNGELTDSGPDPKLPLRAEGAGDVLTRDGTPGHQGLRWSTVGIDARVRAEFAAGSTMPANKMLVTKVELTIETVVSVQDTAVGDQSSRIVYVGTATGEYGKYSLSVGELDSTGNRGLQFHMFVQSRAALVGQWFVPRADMEQGCVVHLVLNAARAQVDLYVNGELSRNSILTRPPSDHTFTWVDPTWYLVLGNTEGGGHSLQGSINYTAIYSRPLSPDEVKTNAAILKQSDDGPG